MPEDARDLVDLTDLPCTRDCGLGNWIVSAIVHLFVWLEFIICMDLWSGVHGYNNPLFSTDSFYYG